MCVCVWGGGEDKLRLERAAGHVVRCVPYNEFMVSACTAHGHETEEAATAEWPVQGSAMSYPIMIKGQCDQLT